jgi:hypothetical protein
MDEEEETATSVATRKKRAKATVTPVSSPSLLTPTTVVAILIHCTELCRAAIGPTTEKKVRD